MEKGPGISCSKLVDYLLEMGENASFAKKSGRENEQETERAHVASGHTAFMAVWFGGVHP